ncbi:MAG TPA: TetR/AcrR family transcriptional regulator [Acidimicrobiia bacterium]
MSDGQDPGSGGRTAQKRRTRAAIVAATRVLLAAGATPSIDEIAVAADVSRRTIYMYFPTLDQLLLDAASGLLAETIVENAIGAPAEGDDVVTRADALAHAIVELAPEALPLGRKIIALTVDAAGRSDHDGPTRRGYRRIEWIERALAPLREAAPPAAYERLVSALAIVLGWEALVVLEDVRGLDNAAQDDTVRWATRVLVEAAIADAADSAGAGGSSAR